MQGKWTLKYSTGSNRKRRIRSQDMLEKKNTVNRLITEVEKFIRRKVGCKMFKSLVNLSVDKISRAHI